MNIPVNGDMPIYLGLLRNLINFMHSYQLVVNCSNYLKGRKFQLVV